MSDGLKMSSLSFRAKSSRVRSKCLGIRTSDGAEQVELHTVKNTYQQRVEYIQNSFPQFVLLKFSRSMPSSVTSPGSYEINRRDSRRKSPATAKRAGN